MPGGTVACASLLAMNRSVGVAAWCVGSIWLSLVSGAAWAQDPDAIDSPPPEESICPAIDENYGLCADDVWSGNCRDFVTAARFLGQAYRYTVEREPDQAASLKTRIWWGCGSQSLSEIAQLLVRIGTSDARAVLQEEPYRSLNGISPTPGAPISAATSASQVTDIDCESPLTDADRDVCQARELEIMQARHQRLYSGCMTQLEGAALTQLEQGERNWRTRLAAECTDSPCKTQSTQNRDAEIEELFPQCGAPVPHPETAGITHQAKTGMLSAVWMPATGESEQVPFSYEADKKSRGRMSTTLGRGGEMFRGTYTRVDVTHEEKDEYMMAVYDGWTTPAWAAAGTTYGTEWGAASYLDFVHLYSGKVVATLTGNQGGQMRCQIDLDTPEAGLSGGGKGHCQISNGGKLSLSF